MSGSSSGAGLDKGFIRLKDTGIFKVAIDSAGTQTLTAVMSASLLQILITFFTLRIAPQ